MKCSTCGEDKLASRDKDSAFGWRKETNNYYPRCKKCIATSQRENWTKKRRAETEGERDAIARNPIPFFCADIILRAILDRDTEWFETDSYEILRDTANLEEDSVRRMREHVEIKNA